MTSLKRRNIPEQEATEHITNTLDQLQPQLKTIICGDFNTRIGDRKPTIEDDHPDRTTADTYICTRAPWFIQLCTQY
jgi:hypothetical protein